MLEKTIQEWPAQRHRQHRAQHTKRRRAKRKQKDEQHKPLQNTAFNPDALGEKTAPVSNKRHAVLLYSQVFSVIKERGNLPKREKIYL